jgi:hypothetical protein
MQEEEAARVESEVDSEPLDEDVNDDIDNETNTPTDKGSSAASKVLAWLKLLTSNVHHPMTFRGLGDTSMVKEISFDVLTYPKSSRDIVKWEELVKETVSEDHYEEVFQKLQELDYRLVKGSTVKFSGRVHCEAMMATAVLLAKKRYLHKVGDLLLHEHDDQAPLGVSKKCCPVCTSILKAIFAELGMPTMVLGSHSNIYPCSFPPGLPKSVTSKVVKEYSWLVRKELLLLTTPKRRVSSMMSHAGGPLQRQLDDDTLDRFVDRRRDFFR